MKESYAAAVARLEEGLANLQANVVDLGEELRYPQRRIVNRPVWAMVVLVQALGGKDALQAVL